LLKVRPRCYFLGDSSGKGIHNVKFLLLDQFLHYHIWSRHWSWCVHVSSDLIPIFTVYWLLNLHNLSWLGQVVCCHTTYVHYIWSTNWSWRTHVSQDKKCSLFYLFVKFVQINYIFSDNVCIFYIYWIALLIH
jgi:NADH:ubiquinone oxidoreductase subunit 4 (subunit M)